MLMASVIKRALISMPEAMPARSGDTEPVVVLVVGELVRPMPMPAISVPGSMVTQLAPSSPDPIRMAIKPIPNVSRPSGIATRA
ncbi:hypothetical protein C8D77_103460 [Mesorhizobium loti]|uniref:Uncharacterized protein n=1 Tax=Rhizobium loti TaxID=381 RepID=A0A8E2WDU2_RHILI|nr:hypothetical protein C8D77_103460 [Mesorhizobium loti]